MRHETPMDVEVVHILDMPIKRIREAECTSIIIDQICRGVGGWVITCNVDIIRRYRLDEKFRQLASKATTIVADGMPLVWASRIQGVPLPERVTGSNLIKTLSGAAAAAGKSVFLLGGDPGTANAAAVALQKSFPGIDIAGTFCPSFGFESKKNEMQKIRRLIVDAQPSIVFVALGCPKQEILISQLQEMLPESWWIGVGISFSFLSGNVARAPYWMQRSGLEWLHRLWQEPRRLARRYLIDGIPFATFLLANSFWARIRGRRSVY